MERRKKSIIIFFNLLKDFEVEGDLLDNEKKDITLEVKKDNYSAIKVYESKGFETKAVRKGYYNGLDGLLMERKYKDSSR